MPKSFHMRTPCRPSAPPVNQLALLAASASNRPRPSVIMISARWRKRAMMKLVRYPSTPGRGGDHQTGQRLAPPPFRDQARGVGGEAEIGCVAERYDAGIPENEIER